MLTLDTKAEWLQWLRSFCKSLPFIISVVQTVTRSRNTIYAALPWMSPRRIARFARLNLAKRNGGSLVCRCPANGCLMDLAPSHWITLDWYVRGDYELGTVRRMRRFLGQGMVCLDVGANVGYFSLLMARQVGKQGSVFAFEPTPSTFKLLQRNIALNSFPQATSINLAIGDYTGNIELHIGPPGLEVYNSVGAIRHPGASGSTFQKIVVPISSLDNYCTSHGIRQVDCVKIDVEGAELSVLRGMRQIFDENSHIVVLVEFSDVTASACGNSVEAIAEYLEALGFSLYTVDKDGCLFPIVDNIPRNGEMVWASRRGVAGLGG